MPTEIKDVAETVPAEVVKESVETTQEETTTPEEVQQPVQSASPEAVTEGEVDEKNVPWKNRAMEYERKLRLAQQEISGIQTSLPNIIEQAVAKAIPSQNATPTYTKEELIRFKNSTDDSQQKSWAELQLENLRSKETQEYFESQRQKDLKTNRVEQEKQAAWNYVVNTYPVMFEQGGSFNPKSPLFQKMDRIMRSDETLRSHPSGLRVAADMALAEHIRETQPSLMQRELKLKRQVKKLERATLVEGAGQPQSVKQPNHLGDAMERHRTNGDPSSLKAVNAELIKKIHAGLV
jgi:hypothetical protein